MTRKEKQIWNDAIDAAAALLMKQFVSPEVVTAIEIIKQAKKQKGSNGQR